MVDLITSSLVCVAHAAGGVGTVLICICNCQLVCSGAPCETYMLVHEEPSVIPRGVSIGESRLLPGPNRGRARERNNTSHLVSVVTSRHIWVEYEVFLNLPVSHVRLAVVSVDGMCLQSPRYLCHIISGSNSRHRFENFRLRRPEIRQTGCLEVNDEE